MSTPGLFQSYMTGDRDDHDIGEKMNSSRTSFHFLLVLTQETLFSGQVGQLALMSAFYQGSGK